MPTLGTRAPELAVKEARRAAKKASKAKAAATFQTFGNVDGEYYWDDAVEGQTSKRVAGQANPCGAPARVCDDFVCAKIDTSDKKASQPQNDLDDLLGEVLASTAPAKKPDEFIPDFQCTSCDGQILRITNHVWGDVDYMFLRNNYPQYKKLKVLLLARANCCAYCCQCSWKSSDTVAALTDVAEGLRWRVVN